MTLPSAISNLLQLQSAAGADAADTASRVAAVQTMLYSNRQNEQYSSSNRHHGQPEEDYDRLLFAAVAATLHPRHLYAAMQWPPLLPARTPWAIQHAVKALRRVRRTSEEDVEDRNDNNNNNENSNNYNDDGDEPIHVAFDQFLDLKLSRLRQEFRRAVPADSAAAAETALMRAGGEAVASSVAGGGAAATATTAAASTAAADLLLATRSLPFASRHIRLVADEAGDGVHGRVVFAPSAASCPAGTELFSIPPSLLFNKRTVAAHSALGAVLTKRPWRAMLDAEGEALLVLTLIFERHLFEKKKKNDHEDDAQASSLVSSSSSSSASSSSSHWRELFESCPRQFPHIPLCWPASDLAELDPAMLAAVEEKSASLPVFVAQCRNLLGRVAAFYSSSSSASTSDASDPLDSILSSFSDLPSIVTEESVTWARCVFDSRSFILKYPPATSSSSSSSSAAVVAAQEEEEEELTTLAPFVDMLNHDAVSDVLHKRIDPATGNFVMLSGPPPPPPRDETEVTNQQEEQHQQGIEEDEEEEEVYLSYGALESWELLVSYGFVPRGAESGSNPYDALRLPLAFEDEEDDDDKEEEDNEDSEEVADPLLAARRRAVHACGFGALRRHGLFIPVDGAIGVAVRRYVSIWLAASEAELEQIIERQNQQRSQNRNRVEQDDDGDEEQEDATTAAVRDHMVAALQLYLDSQSTRIDEDEELLLRRRDRHHEHEEGRNSQAALTDNQKAAVVARLTLKQIAQRGLAVLMRGE